jgi:hypothetical protein
MAATSSIKATKFQIKYTNNNGTYTFANIKNSGVTDANILATAQAFVSIQEYDAERIFKLVDSTITNGE